MGTRAVLYDYRNNLGGTRSDPFCVTVDGMHVRAAHTYLSPRPCLSALLAEPRVREPVCVAGGQWFPALQVARARPVPLCFPGARGLSSPRAHNATLLG